MPLRRSGATLALAFAMIVAMSVFFVSEVVDLRRAMGELRRNDTARIQLRNVLLNLLNVETAQRGFLLTGDVSALQPYHAGRGAVRDSLRLAASSGYEHPDFLRNLRALGVLAESKLAEVDHTVQLRRQGHDAAALAVVRTGYGMALMRQARDIIGIEVERLRIARDATMDGFNDRLLRAAVILVLILTTVVCMAVQAWRSLLAAARNNSELARRLALEASHDVLTGLPNRRFFDKWARRLLAKSQRSGKPFTLLALDLDRFKDVNDSHGHGVGDEVLKAVAVRFQALLGGGEFLARLGGDEFAILIEGELSRHQLARFGERLIHALAPSLHPQLAAGAVGVSIGAASFPLDGRDLEGLVQAADDALYASKHGGRGIVSFARAGASMHTQAIPA
ncbi:diguanylate cyclase [Massilia sp. G4R7]|uniref:Diguanylate cyclase n=1 Tax=Massilia phyllostachyos TaxID=2898585 RepID=A0ABS8QAW9_9BURK|nr:diguanylate cyclase [Massilia phyllostachyos]MCD2518101.1 diguanylate cyclase [Massilia phyllostachyos]